MTTPDLFPAQSSRNFAVFATDESQLATSVAATVITLLSLEAWVDDRYAFLWADGVSIALARSRDD